MKVKFKHLFMVAFVAMASIVTFTSCSQDDDAPTNGLTSKDIISYNVGIGNALSTRATAVTPSNYEELMKNFVVTAVTDTTNLNNDLFQNYYIGNFSSPSLFTNKGSGWLGETYYWPADSTEKLSFYAFSPAQDTYNIKNISMWKVLTLTADADASKQVDYMSAYVPAVNKYTNNGTVKLNFKHLMSQVRFAVDKSSIKKGYQISVNGITIRNIRNKFFYDIVRHKAVNPAGNGPVATFEENNATHNFVAPITAVNNLVNEKGIIDLTPAGGALLLPPQLFTLLSTDERDRTKPATSLQCLEISCKIYNTANKKYVVGSATSFGKIYVELNRPGKNEDNPSYPGGTQNQKDPGWISGNCYTYILKFDGSDGWGVDPEGKPHNITFSVTVDDWKDANPNPNLNF